MFQKKAFYTILKHYTDDIEVLEKHLILYFMEQHHIDYTQSHLLHPFLTMKREPQLLKMLSTLNIDTIKTLENYLELLIPQEDKKINGAFFTPIPIVTFMIEELAPQKEDICVDPSCGSGAFLLGLVQYFQKKYQLSIKKIIQKHLYGYDILAYNIRRAKLLLSLYALQQGEILEEEDFHLFCQNSLTEPIQKTFDIVIGNPPYIKFQDLDIHTRTTLLENYQTTVKGTFNTYFAFFEKGYALLNQKGKMGYITPNNFFTSLAGEPLRSFLHHTASIYKIIDFKDQKIFDAQTYTALTFMNKKKNPLILYDKISPTQTYETFLHQLEFSKNHLKSLKVEKWRLLKEDEKENIQQIETIGTPLKELFDISASIATLKDEIFFVEGKKDNNGLIKKETPHGTFFIEEAITKPIYKISKMKTQSDIEKNQLRIITPYTIINQKAVIIEEKVFQEHYPYCYAYLCSEKEILKQRDKGKKVFQPFYQWGRTQGITRRGKRVVNPTFSESPRFLTILEEESYYTNGYGIFFKKHQENTLFETTHPLAKEENIFLLQKILNSYVMDYYIKTTSVTIQGGYPCYQKNFIEQFTIPSFTQKELHQLQTLHKKEEIDTFLIEKYHLKFSKPNRSS